MSLNAVATHAGRSRAGELVRGEDVGDPVRRASFNRLRRGIS